MRSSWFLLGMAVIALGIAIYSARFVSDFSVRIQPDLHTAFHELETAARAKNAEAVRKAFKQVSDLHLNHSLSPQFFSEGSKLISYPLSPEGYNRLLELNRQAQNDLIENEAALAENTRNQMNLLALAEGGVALLLIAGGGWVLAKQIELTGQNQKLHQILDEKNREIEQLNERLKGMKVETLSLEGELSSRGSELVEERKNSWMDEKFPITNPKGGAFQFQQLILRSFGRMPIWFFLIDIDHFRKLNEIYGHFQADDVIRVLCGIFENHTRFGDDIYYRWGGGEEFAIVISGVVYRDAVDIVRRIEEAIRTADVWVEGKEPGTKVQVRSLVAPQSSFTVSGGLSEATEIPEYGELLAQMRALDVHSDVKFRNKGKIEICKVIAEKLFKLSDRRTMDEAKVNGRNRIIVPDEAEMTERFARFYPNYETSIPYASMRNLRRDAYIEEIREAR